jgi:hypothetical protein
MGTMGTTSTIHLSGNGVDVPYRIRFVLLSESTTSCRRRQAE